MLDTPGDAGPRDARRLRRADHRAGARLEANRRRAPVEIARAARAALQPLAACCSLDAAILAVDGLGAARRPAVARRLASPTSRSASWRPASTRISRELALIPLGVGVALADVALASVASGLPLVLGWSPSPLPFAALLGAPRSGERDGGDRRALVDRRPRAAPRARPRVRADRILAPAGLLGQIARSPPARRSLFNALPARSSPARRAAGVALVAAGAIGLVAVGCARLAGARLAHGSTRSRSPRSPTSPGSRSTAPR